MVLEESNQHKIIKLHRIVKINKNWEGTTRVGGNQIWEIGTANTAQGMTTCDELDHFGLVESLVTKTFGEDGDVLIRLRGAVVSCRPSINATTTEGNNRSSACGHCKYGGNGDDVGTCAGVRV